jgi:cell division protease FtsH
MNEAALLTARRRGTDITMSAMEDAIDRVLAGPERKTRVMSDQEKRVIAYHEGGHTLVGHVLEGTDPIHKVSIVSRGRALGWTLALPTEDKYLKTRSELVDTMTMLLGGRTAEELVFGEPTTGASDDIERCTEVARAMVTTYGMSDRLGPQQLGGKSGEVFLGRDYGHEPTYSDEIAGLIDDEVRRLVDHAHDRARFILVTHREILDRLAASLVEKETLDDGDLAEVFGDVDKGTGIADVPLEELERPRQIVSRRQAAEVTVAEAPRPEVRPVPVAPPEPAWRRMLRRWGMHPRPSGT